MADIIDFKTRGKGPGEGPPPTPPIFHGPGLPQVLYRIRTVDKVTGNEIVNDRRGHIVVTASNIVLFDENQEMLWGIPNDDFVISFERLEKSEPNSELGMEYEEIDIEGGDLDD